MGNSGINKLWQPSNPDTVETTPDNSRETSSTTGSVEYRSAQGDSFSDEDKQPCNLCTEKPSLPVLGIQYPQELMENKNIAKEVLQMHYSDLLVDIAHPYSLVSDLLQNHMIDCSIGTAMLSDNFTRREKMVMLVDALIDAVAKLPNDFHTLIRILGDKPFHRSVARLLQQSYGVQSTGREVIGFTYSSAVLNYAKELKVHYNKLPTLHRNHKRIYNLMLRQDDIKCTLDKRMILQSPAYNSLQHSLFNARPITYADIFHCDTTTECILLEGEQCVGKTQLVQELCKKWEDIPGLKRFQLILLLDLKNKVTQNMEGPHGLLYHHDSGVQQELIRSVCDAKGKDVLIIMDGLEQLPGICAEEGQKCNPFIVKIIEGKVLPKSMKLITLTPSTVRHVISTYDLTNIRHIQLLGLRKEHLKQMLLSPRRQHVNFRVQSLMYLPLNASLITKIYRKCIANHHDTPLTLTQYYKLYCFDLIWDYLSQSSIDPSFMQTPPQSLNDLHPEIHEQIMLLAKIALVEVIHSDISFHDQFEREDFVHFGLMSLFSHMDGKNLRFLNQMLQAFLAAYFISQLEDYEKEQIFFSHSLSEMATVWKFVAGLSGLTATILDMLKSSIDDQHFLPFIVSLLHEQEDASVVQYVLHGSIITYSLSYPEESRDVMSRCFSLGYCIASSNSVWRLNFSSCDLKMEDLKALVCGINSPSTISGSISSLQLDNNLMTVEKLRILSELPILQQITTLHLNSCYLTQEGLNYLAGGIIPTMPHLQVLDIGNNGQNCKMTKLFSSLADLTELQELCLEDTALEFEDMVPLNKILSLTESTVIELSIGGKNMPLESMNLLIDTVLSQSSIETLRISDLDLTRNIDTITLLETNTKLTRLVFFECDLDLTYLTTSLCMNTTLKKLEIFFPLSNAESDIDSQAAIALSDMLEVNRSLSELCLYSYKPIERKKVVGLVETLKYNYSLEALQLPNHYSRNFSTSELNIVDPRVYWRTWPCVTQHYKV